jgi:hypothetical protein
MHCSGCPRGLEVGFRRGWKVCPIDFDRLDNLYDLHRAGNGGAGETLQPAEPTPNWSS